MMFSFAFGETGDDSDGTVGLGLPLLGGAPRELILGPVERSESRGSFSVWRGPAGAVGWAKVNPGGELEDVTKRLYAELLRCAGDLHLYRIWNCVPQINRENGQGLENYRAFCKGRSLAFEEALGKAFASRLPAASAVGTAKAELTVVFLAGTRPARYFENPAQVPAYEYPPEHGPRSPSFARATVVERGQTLDAYLSGTSAIMGHTTVAPHDTAGQLDCTIENLGLVSRACGLGAGGARHFKVYLRNPADRPAVALQLERRVAAPGDCVTYLGADICRAALNVEIELSARGAARI